MPFRYQKYVVLLSGNSVEHGNLRDNIHLRMDFDARLRASELCPAKERHAEVDSRRVHGIEPAVQFKLFCNPSLLRKEYHVENKLLIIWRSQVQALAGPH